jgi:putative glycosyltransferase (TIGR04372 family)
MMKSKLIKLASKDLLSSDLWFYSIIRQIASKTLFLFSRITRPISAKASFFLEIYSCVFSFDAARLAVQINSSTPKLDRHLVVASRAFFEMAFNRGELEKISNYLEKVTNYFPHLFTPWKLLHYSYYFTKSWEPLASVNKKYELYRAGILKSVGVLGYDVIVGDHVTSSIGHSQIFFDFQIRNSSSLLSPPKIGIYQSDSDRMSSFYDELIPGLFSNTISNKEFNGQPSDLKNFIQDSFSFLVAKKYFNYLDERGRTKYLASWAATGAKSFDLTSNQRIELRNFLQGVGLTDQDWFVVLHVREGSDGSIRNADLESYYGAIKAVIAHGGWVFRIGDASMTPIRDGISRVIDLPFSKIPRPNYIDLYLLASARFVICTCSGPSDFPFYFNVPRLATNWPFMTALHGTADDMCLPISYRRIASNQIVPLIEQITSMSYDNEPKIRALTSVTPIRNSAEQIRQATVEMIELTDKHSTRANFPRPLENSLFYKYEDKIWFMGSIAQSFLADNPNYLD